MAVPLINAIVGLPPPIAVDGTVDPDDLVGAIAIAAGKLSREGQQRVLAFVRWTLEQP